MEKEGHNMEPEEFEEEEEVGLLVRGSKSNIESEISRDVRNCDAEENGYANSPSLTENGVQESTFDGDQEGAEEHVNPTPAETKDGLENCVYYDKDEDGKLKSSSSVKESNERNAGDVSINGSHLTDLQYHGNLKDKNLSNFNILPTETSPQEPATVQKSSTVEEIESADIDQITDSEIDTKDYDVENVLHKQNTHDLYCPNCNSCITRRVILRKRKQNIRISCEDVKRNKLETAIESTADFSTQLNSDQRHDDPLISLDDSPILAANEPEIFRCLSCFSFFIPTGSSFKLFRIFGEKGDKENVRDEQGVRTNKSWFSSIFASDKEKGSADQGKDDRLDVGKNNNEVILPSSNVCDESLFIQETTPPVHVDSRSIDPCETGANISISQSNELERAGKIMNDAMDISVCAIIGKKGDPVNHFKVDTNNNQLNISNVSNEAEVTNNKSLTPDDKTQGSAERLVESSLPASQTGLKILITSNEESTTLEKKQADKICDSSGKDTIITVEEGPTETAESATFPNLANETRVVEQQGTISTGVNNIEIIKSIVYGGLAESITSLSIVLSAAGGGIATLYILALGVANLIGGFLIVLNNLWELKKDRLEQASNQIMEQGDRYRELLGHRENFVIHAIVVVLSYIIFGLVPPAVYGFSFRKSDDMKLKLIAAGAASLVCTIVLASGKVYTQRPPKSYLKTITFYVVLGFTVPGVSFGAGLLMNRLLEKLGLFQSSSEVINLFQPGVTPAWASY